MRFVAIDVETANADLASICQIGIARYEDSLLVEEWKSYIDPNDFFNSTNISIHGIDETTVAGAPKLPDVSCELYRLLDDHVTVSHTHFDRTAISQACCKHGMRIPKSTWLDSARVARIAWEQFARKGYGLHNICHHLGYEFNHHDALEDAKAAAHIFIAAMDKTGRDVHEWLQRVKKPISVSTGGTTSTTRKPLERNGHPNRPLAGEVLVFTGALEISRHVAAGMAAEAGCQVQSGLTRKTTILVVGDQDVTKLAGHEKSSKHRKAEDLIAEGASLRILRESDFKQLIALAE